ncbi:MAG: efflux RND transporter permease subunit, partial [Cyanobacteriota bacterium]|nr:efflux RND transporter permease subunit [Cyanobacteriota bacterium]
LQNPSFIERLDGQRAVYFSANLQEGKALGDATDEVLAIARSVIPPNVSLDLKGDAASGNSVLKSFAGTLTLATICMLGVLLLLFGRLLEPLVVGLSLPLSLVGAMLALLLTQSDFGMISLIGLIFLLGLLDKNAVLLMDYVNQLRQNGMSRTEALLQTGQVRLRPILMTTFSTILGMLPLALGLGAGAELRQPMAVAIIGGLLTSTLLSLLVVPVLYALLEDGWGAIARQFKK